MAVNKPVGDSARKGAVKSGRRRRPSWGAPKRSRKSGEFMAVKKPAKKTKAAKKFQGRAGGEEGREKEKKARAGGRR